MAGNNDIVNDGSVTDDDILSFEKDLRDPDPKESGAPAPAPAPAAAPAPATDEEHRGQAEEDEDLDEGAGARVDTELADASSEEEREAIRERRRQEKRDKRQRARDRQEAQQRRLAMLEEENRQLAAQVAQIADTQLATQITATDAAIAQATQAEQHFASIHADAISKGDGIRATEALTKKAQAEQARQQLGAYKANLEQVAQQRQRQTRPGASPLSTEAVTRAQAFQQKHSWYKSPQAKDSDSQVLTLLDSQVRRDGFDPASDEYWEELEARGRTYLPHRFSKPAAGEGGDNGGQAGNGGGGTRPRNPTPGGNNSARRSNQERGDGSYTLSAARIQAMKDAGIWDDIPRRNKMIQRYREQDKQQQAN